MYELITQFREHSQNAIRHYEKDFILTKNMSVRRSKDIVALREILNRDTREVNNLIQAMNNYLEKISTGWWIFKTGKSRLRDNLYDVIERYHDPIAQSLIKYVSTVQYQLDEALGKLSTLQETEHTKTLKEKNDLIKDLGNKICELTKKIEILTRENHKLSKSLSEYHLSQETCKPDRACSMSLIRS